MTPESSKAVLNALVPPNLDRNIPGAGDAGAFAFVQKTVRDDIALTHLFEHGISCLDNAANAPFETLPTDVQVSVLQDLEKSEPMFFAELIRLTYMGYYSQPRIRALLGLSADPVHPKGYEVGPESPETIANLTAPVVARGKVYRDVE